MLSQRIYLRLYFAVHSDTMLSAKHIFDVLVHMLENENLHGKCYRSQQHLLRLNPGFCTIWDFTVEQLQYIEVGTLRMNILCRDDISNDFLIK